MFLDTSGLFAYHQADEAVHAKAQSLFKLHKRNITHSLILAEFVALATARKLPRNTALAFLSAVIEHPRVEVIWIDRQSILNAVSFLETRLDKSYSLCDAVSFHLMTDRNLREALTTDHHFEQEGFLALLR